MVAPEKGAGIRAGGYLYIYIYATYTGQRSERRDTNLKEKNAREGTQEYTEDSRLVVILAKGLGGDRFC